MGGLGLISAGFLTAAAGLATVPIVLHLLFRPKPPRVNLGSLRFLRIALRDQSHRRKIRRWLLLALRVAGVLLLGLLFARPFVVRLDVPAREREVAILIDRSASMGAGAVGDSAYARARLAAAKLLAGLPVGTTVHLATFDASGVVPIPSGTVEDAPKAAGFAGTDYAKGIAWARDVVVQSRRKLRSVHLFTDLQRVQLDAPTASAFPPGVEVELDDVGSTARGNLAVDEARVSVQEIREGAPPVVSAIVSNRGAFVARDVLVRLMLDGPGGSVQAEERIDVAGRSRREVRFRPEIRKAGVYRGTVAVFSDDDWRFDNLRHLAFEARRAASVLLVDGDPGPTVYSNETYFLESALRLRLPGSGSSATAFEPRRIAWDGGASWPSLGETDVVVLANVAEVPKRITESLRNFVNGGGKLVLFAGDRVGPGALASFREAGLLPAEIEAPADGPFRLESWDQKHPMLAPFADPQHGDLRSLGFTSLARLRPRAGSTVLAATTEGLPILVEARLGAGVVLQWAAPADQDWGDWTIQRLYLPVIYQMMSYLTGRLPESGLVQVAPLGPGKEPGIELSGLKVVVRNGDPAESAIDRATPAEFRSAFGLPEPTAEAEESPESSPPGGIRPGEFWRGVAWALLAILVVETFVANRTYA
jgi:hypothetical protein